MRIYNKQDGSTVTTIITNHSMTLDEAIRLVGTIHEDYDEENVEIQGEWYYYDDLDIDFADEQ